MSEIWKPVVEYEGLYEVSNLGRVKSLPRNGTTRQERILKPTLKKSGYVDICLQKKGKRKYTHLHQIVARAFIPNPDNKPQVNHIDGNKQNNAVDNLEWNTASENLRHKFRVLGWKADRHGMRPVKCIETGVIFDGVKAAERAMGLSYGSISHVVNRYPQRKSAGFHWKYADSLLEDR